MNVYQQILTKQASGIKQMAVLIDPDKVTEKSIAMLAQKANAAQVDYFFLGGSLLTSGSIKQCCELLKSNSDIPVLLFPGSIHQIEPLADALLFLSMISGRNPELLIGQHVIAAPLLKQMKLEVISTGYLLIEGGNNTTVQYISNTIPIPADKYEIAACTALAGEMLGLKLIFAEAGSGAVKPINAEMIAAIREQITIPLITGGGIKTPEKALENCKAGADIIVLGNSIEKDIQLIHRMSDAIHSFK